MKHSKYALIASLLSVAMLAACGGGGGGKEVSSSPVSGGGSTVVEAPIAQPAPGGSAGTGAEQPSTPGVVPEQPVTPPTNPDTTPEPVVVPVAITPEKIEILAGRAASVSGLSSTGVNGSALSYLWTLESKPATSTLTLLDTMSPVPSFWADVEGTYRFKLVVSSGGKTSEPAYTTVEAVPTGLMAPFVSFTASGFSMPEYASIGGCNYYRAASHFKDFWTFVADAQNPNCSYLTPGTLPGDLEFRSSFGGGQLAYMGRSLMSLQDSGVSGKSVNTWANVNTLTSYSLGISAEPLLLANLPSGKTVGSTFYHSTTPAYATEYSQSVVQYKLEGKFEPTNVPVGWELEQEIRVLVTMGGSTFENGQPGGATIKLFEKTFISDFNETIPLNLNIKQAPIAFVGTAAYNVSVVNRFTFKRIADK